MLRFGELVKKSFKPILPYFYIFPHFPSKKFADNKIIPTFAIPKQTRRNWRGGRVVDCGGLENR